MKNKSINNTLNGYHKIAKKCFFNEHQMSTKKNKILID